MRDRSIYSILCTSRRTNRTQLDHHLNPWTCQPSALESLWGFWVCFDCLIGPFVGREGEEYMPDWALRAVRSSTKRDDRRPILAGWWEMHKYRLMCYSVSHYPRRLCNPTESLLLILAILAILAVNEKCDQTGVPTTRGARRGWGGGMR